MSRLAGKAALVTGAAQGIGLAIARAFVNEGASVLMTDIQDDRCADEARAIGAESVRLDVCEESDWASAVAFARETFGRLDVVVNNAGVAGMHAKPEQNDPEHADLAHFRDVMRTNLEGVVLGCKHAIGAMRQNDPKGGSIINIGSRSGLVGVPRAAPYAASKAAVLNHTRSVALYCAEEGLNIRCNVIQPAAILTPMWEAMLGEPGTPERKAVEEAIVADCPLKRFGTPEEVAELAVYLASDASGYTTGSAFNLDGGMLAGAARPRV